MLADSAALFAAAAGRLSAARPGRITAWIPHNAEGGGGLGHANSCWLDARIRAV